MDDCPEELTLSHPSRAAEEEASTLPTDGLIDEPLGLRDVLLPTEEGPRSILSRASGAHRDRNSHGSGL